MSIYLSPALMRVEMVDRWVYGMRWWIREREFPVVFLIITSSD